MGNHFVSADEKTLLNQLKWEPKYFLFHWLAFPDKQQDKVLTVTVCFLQKVFFLLNVLKLTVLKKM